MDATEGYKAGYPYCAPAPARPFPDEVGVDPGRLRIAWSIAPLAMADVPPACSRAVESAAAKAEELGHHVEQADLPIDREVLAFVMLMIVACLQTAELAADHPITGRPVEKCEAEPISWLLSEWGKQQSALDLIAAAEARRSLGATLADFFAVREVPSCPPWLSRPFRWARSTVKAKTLRLPSNRFDPLRPSRRPSI